MHFDSAGATRFVLETSLRAFLAALAVGLVLRLLRVRAPAVLHGAWTGVLVSMLLMPVLPSVVPALRLPVPAFPGGVLGRGPDADEPFRGVATNGPKSIRVENAASSPGEGDPVPLSDSGPVSATGARALPSWLPPASLAIYAAGTILLLGRLFYGWFGASALVARAKRNGALDVGAAAPVYQSPEVTAPMTVGAIRPVIVLPVSWTTWDGDMLAATIAHETAHVRRRDPSINLAAHLNGAIFWFHPLAWWLHRRLTVLAEHACDETAARALGD